MFQDEKIVETKTCRHCGESFDITDKDLEFYEKVSPVFPLSQPFPQREKGEKENIPLNGGGTKGGVIKLENGKVKYLIPTPTLCPDCRQQRRLSFRNEKTIVFRNCDMTGKRIFSMYSPDKPYKVYHYNDWFTDKWNALDYGQEFDFSKSFFEQFGELDLLVPKMSLSNLGVENSDFVSQVGYCKNCYLIFNAEEDENCYYGKDIYFSRHCVDSFGVGESEQCYYCVRCIQCFNVEYGIYSYNCKDCKYIFSCIGCKNCLGCVNLTNSEYCIFNKKYSREEYFSRLSSLSRNEIKIGYEDLLKISPKNCSVDVKNSENIFGDLISGSKNIYKCFQIASSRDIRYSTNIVNSEDIMDTNYFGVDLQKSYESSVIGHGSNLNFCFDCWNNVDNLMYCFFCVNGVKNCFGCNGLHNNEQYCILNKQYTREEYETLVPKIIEHMSSPQPSPEGEGVREWGEFFPSSLSPFGYNETVAQEYYPLTRDEILSSRHSELDSESLKIKNFNQKKDSPIKLRTSSEINSEGQLIHGEIFNWSDYEVPFPKVEKIIPASKLPDDISKIPDDILNWAIECEVTKKPFRIIKKELEFYRKHNLPLPRKHPDQRHLDRMSLRNPRKLYTRKCDKCGKEIQTTYAPERPEIVYCEECYNKEVY